jgi:hypothetical protein
MVKQSIATGGAAAAAASEADKTALRGELTELQGEMAEASARGEKVHHLHDQVNPRDIGCMDCYFDCCVYVARGCVEGMAATVMIFFLFFYFIFYLIYKFFGSLAACFYSKRNCCSNTGPRGTGHNPCGPCLGGLIKLIVYLCFGLLGGLAYIFYIAALGPLNLLALLSDTYADELKNTRFSLTLLLEEEEDMPSASGQVADVETGLAEAKQQKERVSPSKQVAPDESPPAEEVAGAEAVVPFKPIDR